MGSIWSRRPHYAMCENLTAHGEPCANAVYRGYEMCWVHLAQVLIDEEAAREQLYTKAVEKWGNTSQTA